MESFFFCIISAGKIFYRKMKKILKFFDYYFNKKNKMGIERPKGIEVRDDAGYIGNKGDKSIDMDIINNFF